MWIGLSLALLLALPPAALAQDISEVITETQSGTMIIKQGQVNYQPPQKAETNAAVPQPLKSEDSLRTLSAAWALVQLEDRYEVRLKELSKLLILPRTTPTNLPAFSLLQGQGYFKSRGAGPRIGHFQTAQVRGKTSGTEFLIAVDPATQRTDVTMFDGEAELSDGTTNAIVHSGQQGIVITGQGIRVRPILEATNLVQWWLYYPGVLDPDEIEFTPAEQPQLRASLDAYRAGALPLALEQFPGYPTPAEPATDSQRLYLAGLFLAVGAVDRTETLLSRVPTDAPLALALRTVIAAVQSPVPADVKTLMDLKSEIRNPKSKIASASELLALSYLHQSHHRLDDALAVARAATGKSPNFAFAWERVAELEFSFGRIRRAQQALDRALELGPRNAQAHALRGFLRAADNRTKAALDAFDEAIRLDPALGNAWLGRGLCKIRLAPVLRSSRGNEALTSRSDIRNPKPERDQSLLDSTATNKTRAPVSLSPRSMSGEWAGVRGHSQLSSALDDLATAALLEPNRSLLHSYLGKAFTDLWDFLHARTELDYAKRLDPNDPTPWLYSALLHREQNEINTAVRDLERSIDRNDNRAVYRSQLLLDQDRAVRSSSLANLYQSAGLPELSVREAARAVSDDYGNYSSHLFLSESFNALRDPTRFNLRYETAWFNELLLANLLSPVGGTPLSQQVSQQEYSRLFERDRIGLSSDTQHRSDGQVRELASQYGRVRNTSWALDLDYQHNDGVRPNNELDRIEWYSTFKHQLTAQDSVLLLTKYQDYHSGDNFQYYDWRGQVRTNFTFDELQRPIVLGGYHREWSPGVHTLFLAGRLVNEQRFSDKAVPEIRVSKLNGKPVFVSASPLDVEYRSEFEAFTTEINQIVQSDRQLLSTGARFQAGRFQTHDVLADPLGELCPAGPNDFTLTNCFLDPAAATAGKDDFQRVSTYGYYTLAARRDLFVTAGIAYDHVKYPVNFRHPPIRSGEETADQVGPKAAVVYSPTEWISMRGLCTRGLGGVSLDQSFRLEPTQLAGFVQTFRSVIPESAPGVGSVSAPAFTTLGAAIDLKFRTGTYLGLQAERLSSDVDREIGVFDYLNATPPIVPSSTRQRLGFDEHAIGMSMGQLLGDQWSAGLSYRFASSELRRRLRDIPVSVFSSADETTRSDLHHIGAHVLFNHSSGLFVRAEVNWYAQENALRTHDPASVDVHTDLPDDEFPQFNLYTGWRFPRQRGDVTFGVLNLGGHDYHLNPLNSYPELPHQRVFSAQLRFRF